MNEYIITFTSTEEPLTDSIFTQHVVDRTEAAAKKFFNSTAKECCRKFQSIELLRTDAPATKRNERDTLEVIRQMVADLGPDSYLATAFQGCFEIAEQNIENDFADSLQGRLELAEKKLRDEIAEKQKVRDEAQKTIKELEEKLRESEKDWEAAHAANHVLAEQKDAEIAALQAKALSEDDLEDLRQLLDDRATEADEKAEAAALEIVERADTPDHPDFRQAVLDHRNYVKTAKYYREILGRVVEAQAAYHAGA